MTKMSSSSVALQCEDLMLASSKPVHNHGLKASIHEFVHETARQSLLLASNAAEAGRASGENAEKESDVGTSNIAAVVYTRRCRRDLVVNRVSTLTDNPNTELKHSVSMAEDVPVQGQIEEAAIKHSGKVFRRRKKDEAVPQHTEEPGMAAGSQIMPNTSQFTEKEMGKSSRKRTVTAKTSQTSQTTDLEEATGSHKRKVIAKTSQCKEVETVTGSNDRKVNARASHHTKSDIGSQQINVTEAASQNVELEVHSSERSDRDKKVDPWLSLVHKKVQAEWCVYNPVTMRRANPPNNSLKLLSWNVNGLRALLKGKGDQQPGTAILKLAEKEDFDVLCLQETKLQEKDILTIKEALLPGYDNSLWSCSTAKLGYSGTAVISRINPLSVAYGLGIPYHDREGRIITVEFDKFFLVTSYVPNSGQKLERLAYRTQDWDLSLANFLKNLEKNKPVILTGDLNCAHQEIDIYNPDGNRRSAGFTDEERASFERNFLERGLNDTFRRQHPNTVAYTYWGYRTAARPKNQGWRLDYFLASDALLDLVHDSYTLPDVGGSDHCPIGLTLKC